MTSLEVHKTQRRIQEFSKRGEKGRPIAKSWPGSPAQEFYIRKFKILPKIGGVRPQRSSLNPRHYCVSTYAIIIVIWVFENYYPYGQQY